MGQLGIPNVLTTTKKHYQEFICDVIFDLRPKVKIKVKSNIFNLKSHVAAYLD